MKPLKKVAPITSPIAAFAGRKVLVIGDLVADQYLYGEADRISREAPVLIVRWESSDVKLGGAANAAANLAALGAKVTALGALGNDELGRTMRGLFKQANIRLVVPKVPGLVTEAKTRIMAGGMSTRRQQVLRLDRAAKGPLPEAARREMARCLEELARDVDAILVSDYGGGVLSPEAIAVTHEVASRCPVCVDSRYNLGAFAGACVLKPNEPELEGLTGMRVGNDADFERALATARRKCAGSSLVVTRGKNGMTVVEKGKATRLFAHGTREAVDVTGAGDTVGATLTLGLAAGLGLLESARLANVAGALKVQKIGTVPVSAEELNRELEATPCP